MRAVGRAGALALGVIAVAVVAGAPPPAAITAKDSLVVIPNDFWDATELPSLFYFRTSDVLAVAQQLCAKDADGCEGKTDEAGPMLLPWLRQSARKPGPHVYEREGGYQDAHGLMRGLRALSTPALVCCGHETFIEMGYPGNHKLRWKGGQPSCAEGKLTPLSELEARPDGSLRCDGQLVWPPLPADAK